MPKGRLLGLCLGVFLFSLYYLQIQSNRRTRNSGDGPSSVSGLSSYWRWSVPANENVGKQPIPQHEPETAAVPISNLTRALVIASMKTDDVSWLEDTSFDSLDKKIYVADDPQALYHPPVNKGHEVMIYLTYITDHYDNLPEIILFMHAHRWSWHNNDMLNNDASEMIKRLSSERVIRQGYMNLRCQWLPGCPEWMRLDSPQGKGRDEYEEATMRTVWGELFPEKPLPAVLAQPCCAQFAQWREWVLKTTLHDSVSGRMWEYLWQVAFTGNDVSCPDQHVCHCDGFGLCFKGSDDFEMWFNVRNRKRDLEGDLRKLRGEGRLSRKQELQMQGVIDELNQDLDERRMRALEKGTDPRVRAWIARRSWRYGDGF